VARIVPAGTSVSIPWLPAYVERGGEISFRHPADALDIRLHGFVIKADRDLLDEYCERSFNRPSGGEERWRAAGSHVLLNFVDIPTMGSTDRLDRSLGVVQEKETAIWMPMIDLRRGRMAWGVPYMFVNSSLAMVGGRETYGYPKQLGSIDIPRTEYAPRRLRLRAITMKKHEPNEVATLKKVVKVVRAGPDVPLCSPWTAADDAARDLARLRSSPGAEHPTDAASDRRVTAIRASVLDRFSDPLLNITTGIDDAETALLLAEHLTTGSVPMVLLKQFRDAAQPGAACYQGIVEVAHTVTEFRRGGFLPSDYEVRFSDLDGEPLQRELGIPSNQTPSFALWFEFDFLVQLGVILWEARIERRR
jgi:hypothetical protein